MLVKTGVTYRENRVHKTEDAKLAAPNAKALVVKDGSHVDAMPLSVSAPQRAQKCTVVTLSLSKNWTKVLVFALSS